MKLPEWVVPFKEPKTEIKFINGSYYKYAVEYAYNADKKRTDKITKGIIGRLSIQDGLIPSDKNRLREEVSRIPKVDIKTFGVHKLFTELLGEDIKSIQELFKEDVFETLLLFSMMRWAHQSPIKRVSYYHAHDFCSEHWNKGGR